jgi:hypothetical protein
MRAGRSGDVDDRRPDRVEELAAEDLHIAREHDQVVGAAEQFEQRRRLRIALHGDVLEPHRRIGPPRAATTSPENPS